MSATRERYIVIRDRLNRDTLLEYKMIQYRLTYRLEIHSARASGDPGTHSLVGSPFAVGNDHPKGGFLVAWIPITDE